MQIEISPAVLKKMIQSGLVHPSEIGCLDFESKAMIKALCIKLCQPKNCAQCSSNGLCQQDSLSAAQWNTQNLGEQSKFY
ncbi:MAG: hypothetical protein R3254_05820 [Thiomicrorhabdus sp.]|nr:hypothetical protein [Thiomicrorhabdus sp.]